MIFWIFNIYNLELLKWAERTALTVKHLMLKTLKKKYHFILFSLLLKKKSKRESKNSQLWSKRFKLSPSTTTPLKREKSTRIWVLKSPNWKLNSEKNMPHFLKKSTTSFQDHMPILMPISKETPSSLKKNPKLNIITTKMNNSLNIGSKLWSPTTSLVRKSDKLMNPSSNI